MAATDRSLDRALTDQQRLRLGTEFIAHTDDLWPEGGAPNAEWIRAHVDDILALLDQMIRHDGQDVRRLPHRLHWVLWLLAEIESRDAT
jgi:hypothetical protein